MLLALWGLFQQTRPGFDIYYDGVGGGSGKAKRTRKEPEDPGLEEYRLRTMIRADDDIILQVIVSAVTRGLL
jgi:hypothetical protein